MNKEQFHIISGLLEKQVKGKLSSNEQELLEEWMQASGENRLFVEKLNDRDYLPSALLQFEEVRNSMRTKLELAIPELRQSRVTFFRKWGWVAAAILILAIGSGIYIFNTQSYKSNKSSQITVQTKETSNIIPPGTNRAILTLSNGTQKELTLADNGLQLQSNAILLTTPNGGQYHAVLPDGSKVWLNAASSIKFPSKFDNKERRVEVTGEAYFEIVKNALKPFKVYGSNQEIEVLGTSFNVNVYDDEPNAKTTLIEGAIKINNKILQPGQAYVNGKIIQTNIEQDIAWKNGYFSFAKMNIHEVARQIQRWYDMKIIFQGNFTDMMLNGKMDRGVQLSDIIQFFNDYGFETTLEGRELTVKRK